LEKNFKRIKKGTIKEKEVFKQSSSHKREGMGSDRFFVRWATRSIAYPTLGTFLISLAGFKNKS
jgi:hypothetical protein